MPSSATVANTASVDSESGAGFIVRRYLPSDAEAVVALAEETHALDPGAPVLDPPRWRYVCSDPYANPETYFRVALDGEGRLLGLAYRFDPPRPGGGTFRAVFVVVHPDSRRRGVGKALAEATAGVPVPPEIDPGWYLTSTLDETSEGGWAFAKSLGFKKDRTFLVMERDLDGRPLPESDADARIERFVGASAWQDWAQIHNAAFADDAYAIHHDADHLEDNRPEGFRPDHLRFAKVGGRRVGYVFLRETSSGGYVESIGVLPEARGKGAATALLIDALEYLVDRGHRRVELVVDENNRDALKMYARLGFEIAGRRLHVKKGHRARRSR